MNREPLNSSQPERQILSEEDFGDLSDNNLAMVLISRLVAESRIPEAVKFLRLLRNHIKRSPDIQSRLFLLGRVEAKILLLGG